MNQNQNWLGKLGVFLKDHGGTVGYSLCTLALSIVGLGFALSTLSGGWLLFWIISIAGIAILTLVFIFLKVRREVSNSELQRRNASLRRVNGDLREAIGDFSAQYQAFFRGILSIFADQVLDYGTDERISVYRHDSDKDEFVIVARYSKDSELNSNGDRVSYPANEGVIAEAWRNGRCTPEPLPDPQVDLNGYLRITERRWRIKREVAERFRMKSCCLAAYTLSHPQGAEYGNIAVVVFESKRQGALKTDTLSEQVRRADDTLGPQGELIAKFLVSTENIETRSDIASEEEV